MLKASCEDWPPENAARAQFQLGTIISKRREADPEAKGLLGRANSFRLEAVSNHGKSYLPQSLLKEGDSQESLSHLVDQEGLFDHMVAIEAGKFTLGRHRFVPAESWLMSEICASLSKKLSMVGTESVSPAQLAKILSISGDDIERLRTCSTVPQLRMEPAQTTTSIVVPRRSTIRSLAHRATTGLFTEFRNFASQPR